VGAYTSWRRTYRGATCFPGLILKMSILIYTAKDCFPAHTCRWAALAVPYVPLEQCSPVRACQWAALAVPHVPQEHFPHRHVCTPRKSTFLTGTYAYRRRALPHVKPAEHINLNLFEILEVEFFNASLNKMSRRLNQDAIENLKECSIDRSYSYNFRTSHLAS
jgi:hypothetical protein